MGALFSRRHVLITIGAVLAGVMALLMLGITTPTARAVRHPGGRPVAYTIYPPGNRIRWVYGPPSQDLAGIKCRFVVPPAGPGPCNGTQPAVHLPALHQAPDTLYLVMLACPTWWERGLDVQDLNFDYVSASRTLFFNCWAPRSWIYQPRSPAGEGAALAQPPYDLYAFSTTGMGSGSLSVVEENHVEFLFGDQVDATQLWTVTIV